jgi:hypothetical protein
MLRTPLWFPLGLTVNPRFPVCQTPYKGCPARNPNCSRRKAALTSQMRRSTKHRLRLASWRVSRSPYTTPGPSGRTRSPVNRSKPTVRRYRGIGAQNRREAAKSDKLDSRLNLVGIDLYAELPRLCVFANDLCSQRSARIGQQSRVTTQRTTQIRSCLSRCPLMLLKEW